jgi:Fe-Mn family superoxide dismutase
MELHHAKHHQTYVNGLNSALQTIGEAESKGDFTKAATVAPLLNFHGGGHINHSLFWENLAPASREGGGEPDGALKVGLPPPSPLGLPSRYRTNRPAPRKQSTPTSARSTPSARK